MSNRNKNKNQPPPGKPSKPEATPPVPPLELTADQKEGLEIAAMEAEELTTQLGPPSTTGTLEKPVTNFEEGLKRLEGLLRDARAHFDKARGMEAAAKKEEDRLATQKRDTEEWIRNNRKAHENDLTAMKKAALDEATAKKKEVEAEANEKKREMDRAETDLLKRIELVDQRENKLKAQDAANRALETDLAEKGARLAEREANAEQGFLAEKARILKPMEDELKRLREERDRLLAENAKASEKAEEELRAKAKARAEKWAEADAARTQAEAEARRTFDATMARQRQEALDALRTQLADERAKIEARWRAEEERHTATHNQRNADLDARENTLHDRQKKLRASELDLLAAKEMLNEDRAGLDRKVQRLVDERTETLRHELASLGKQLAVAREQRDAYFQDLESRRELDRRFGGRAPDEILAALTATERERDTLSQQLRDRPDARVAERASALERERSAWLEERSTLLGDLTKANGELATRRLAAIELEALKKEKEALEVHKQLLDGAVNQLRVRVDELTRQDDHRNPMTALTSLDTDEKLQTEARTTPPISRATPSLKAFAEELRHRIANGVEGRTLFYAERDVRAFLGGLAMTRLMLLQGISGTGKTSLPLAFANAVGGGIEVVEVQAGWRDRQDLIGYYNAFHRHYYATNFLQALYRAGTLAYRDRLFLIVLDEINLSRPEQFFADFLSALEQPIDARRLTLVADPVAQPPRLLKEGRHLPIPPNVWFIGTANHDESTAEFADKTYDRAHVMEMPRKTDAAHFTVKQCAPRNPLSFSELEKVFQGAEKAQASRVQEATAWLRSEPIADTLQGQFRVGWGNRLEHQLARYLPVVVEAGGSVGEAMDHLLVTKVLRKLKDRHDVRASALEGLAKQLQTSWEKLDPSNPPERCIALIKHEIAAKKGEEQE
jgi:hypothetical protein